MVSALRHRRHPGDSLTQDLSGFHVALETGEQVLHPDVESLPHHDSVHQPTHRTILKGVVRRYGDYGVSVSGFVSYILTLKLSRLTHSRTLSYR